MHCFFGFPFLTVQRFTTFWSAKLTGNNSDKDDKSDIARLAQLVERKALNLVVVGSSPTVGVIVRCAICTS